MTILKILNRQKTNHPKYAFSVSKNVYANNSDKSPTDVDSDCVKLIVKLKPEHQEMDANEDEA